jgi:uncharacterized repeat protein (TIGR03837 family)
MLSRPPVPSVSTFAARPDWDVFCRVIDNFGDIGVCWRLARQLAGERRCACACGSMTSTAFGCCARNWTQGCRSRFCRGSRFTAGRPVSPLSSPRGLSGNFACRIPETFVEHMAHLSPRPVWINLDYLSAEEWVSGCHLLPSPHPRLPLIKYFFFPRFRG